MWIIEGCETCGGSGWDYCEKCERTCEHDRLCPDCGGNGERPIKAEGIKGMAAALAGVPVFRTKKEALAWIEQ